MACEPGDHAFRIEGGADGMRFVSQWVTALREDLGRDRDASQRRRNVSDFSERRENCAVSIGLRRAGVRCPPTQTQ